LKLLEWAHAGSTRNLNQPVRPHAVILWNKKDRMTAEHLWLSRNATAEHIANENINLTPGYRKYTEYWNRNHKGQTINLQRLLDCYYSSVHVLLVPNLSSYDIIDEQRKQLDRIIRKCCAESYQVKERCRALLNSDDFRLLVSQALDHFSRELDKPFDFAKASLDLRPVPTSLKDNIVIFADLVAHRLGLQADTEKLFTNFTSLVASCILLDISRQRRKGPHE